MKRGIVFACLLAVLAIGSFSFAGNQHTVTVTVKPFAKLTVLDNLTDIATAIEANEVRDDGTVTKNFDTKVKLQIRTNSANGCTLSVAGQATQGSDITALLQVGTDPNFNDVSKYTTLTTGGSPIVSAGLTKAQLQNPVELTWRVNGNIATLDPNQTYKTLVTYTVAAK
ncbi:hypothetical protein EDC14_102366 [Hydrogenispora ethanolica]|uniref:Uncharacterized protein n=1 Tax=Hydrogenispora ethanolica TaxID=1082276 RepID=A0A4R1RAM1_HYDET|nr:hypothetical protein [Hydrogenispora ethanolica]TCL62785.1 hypothetical protein EDC14_102366 [Hydrogenispora ethanolica]